MQVRRAALRDSEAIARLSALAAIEDGGRPPALDADRVRQQAFGPHALFECWIAEDRDGTAVGHAIAHRGYDVKNACATVVLCELYVTPEVRRDGVARLLICAVSIRAMELGAREMMITTGLENAVARRFFAAVGAQESAMAMYVMDADELEWLAAEGA
jgi:aminoglycoside 6'-N-acetyltransferase I